MPKYAKYAKYVETIKNSNFNLKIFFSKILNILLFYQKYVIAMFNMLLIINNKILVNFNFNKKIIAAKQAQLEKLYEFFKNFQLKGHEYNYADLMIFNQHEQQMRQLLMEDAAQNATVNSNLNTNVQVHTEWINSVVFIEDNIVKQIIHNWRIIIQKLKISAPQQLFIDNKILLIQQIMQQTIGKYLELIKQQKLNLNPITDNVRMTNIVVSAAVQELIKFKIKLNKYLLKTSIWKFGKTLSNDPNNFVHRIFMEIDRLPQKSKLTKQNSAAVTQDSLKSQLDDLLTNFLAAIINNYKKLNIISESKQIAINFLTNYLTDNVTSQEKLQLITELSELKSKKQEIDIYKLDLKKRIIIYLALIFRINYILGRSDKNFHQTIVLYLKGLYPDIDINLEEIKMIVTANDYLLQGMHNIPKLESNADLSEVHDYFTQLKPYILSFYANTQAITDQLTTNNTRISYKEQHLHEQHLLDKFTQATKRVEFPITNEYNDIIISENAAQNNQEKATARNTHNMGISYVLGG